MDQLSDPMTVRTDEEGKGRENIGEENCALVRNEGIQSEAAAGGLKLSATLEYEPGEADTDTGSQRPQECDSSSSSLFTMEKFTRRSSSSSYTMDSLSSSQTDTGVDCAGIVLNCLFCRFYDLLLMLPGSCERATFSCCPTYKHFSTTVESAPGNDSPSNLDFDCGLLDACQDTGDCLELAMEVSEICYH